MAKKIVYAQIIFDRKQTWIWIREKLTQYFSLRKKIMANNVADQKLF